MFREQTIRPSMVMNMEIMSWASKRHIHLIVKMRKTAAFVVAALPKVSEMKTQRVEAVVIAEEEEIP